VNALRKALNRRTDRGSVSLFAVVVTIGLIVVIGLVVDGGGKIHAQQRAQAAAREAARAGGQAIVPGTAIRGLGAVVDTGPARVAAQNYLTAADVAGSVSIQGGDRIVVRTSETYQPTFLSIVGVGTQTVTGSAEAQIMRTLNGAVR
jgi:Flp pilus assembly protein TadG